MSQSQFADPLTATEVRERLAEAGYEVELARLIRLAESGDVQAERVGGAWMFSDFDFEVEKYVRALNYLDAPDGEPDAESSLSDRFDHAQEQGRTQGERESDGGSLDGLRSGDDLSKFGGRL